MGFGGAAGQGGPETPLGSWNHLKGGCKGPQNVVNNIRRHQQVTSLNNDTCYCFTIALPASTHSRSKPLACTALDLHFITITVHNCLWKTARPAPC